MKQFICLTVAVDSQQIFISVFAYPTLRVLFAQVQTMTSYRSGLGLCWLEMADVAVASITQAVDWLVTEVNAGPTEVGIDQ